jgi:hypothetical protein
VATGDSSDHSDAGDADVISPLAYVAWVFFLWNLPITVDGTAEQGEAMQDQTVRITGYIMIMIIACSFFTASISLA